MKKILAIQSELNPLSIIPMQDVTPAGLKQFKYAQSYCFGMITTANTVGSCLLMEDGSVLTCLHVIFDLEKHKSLYGIQRDQQTSIETMYASNADMTLYFVKEGLLYRSVVEEVLSDGRPHLYHSRVDSNLGWDYALLKPEADLKAVLGKGITFDQNDYTYGRSLLTDNPQNTFFVSRPNIDLTNFEYTQMFIRAEPRAQSTGPLMLHGDDPTPSIKSFSGGGVLNQKGQLYQFKSQANYTLYAKDVYDFIARPKPEDTRVLPYYYQFGISNILFIGKKNKSFTITPPQKYNSVPFDKFKNAVSYYSLEHTEKVWPLTTRENGTIKVWEIYKTDRWDFHLSACQDPTGMNVTKFHFTLRNIEIGKAQSGFAWFSIEGHNDSAKLGIRANAGETEVFTDTSLDETLRMHVSHIQEYAIGIFSRGVNIP